MCDQEEAVSCCGSSEKHFHTYLYGRHFLIRSDHSALQWLMKFRNPEGQIARWIQRLHEYDFEVKHRPGHLHANADAVSRRPCRSTSCTHCDRLEKRDISTDPIVSPIVQLVQFCTTSEPESLPWCGEGLRQTQRNDHDIKCIIDWKNERPPWSKISYLGVYMYKSLLGPMEQSNAERRHSLSTVGK